MEFTHVTKFCRQLEMLVSTQHVVDFAVAISGAEQITVQTGSKNLVTHVLTNHDPYVTVLPARFSRFDAAHDSA
jgi:hypothetical protein